MRFATAALAALCTLAACVTVNDQRVQSDAGKGWDQPQIRGALSGQRQLIATFYALGFDCTSLGYPTLKVAKAPQHGQVSVEQGTAVAEFGASDPRKACNGMSVPSTVVYYASEPGFTGADVAAFDRIGVAGAYGYHVYTINVR